MEKATKLVFELLYLYSKVGFWDTYLSIVLISLLLAVEPATGRYEKMNEDVTNVEQPVNAIKGDLPAGVAEVSNKVTGTISDETAAFPTEIRLNESNTKKLKKCEAALNEEREEKRALETLLKREQDQRKALEMKNFRLIIIIVILFIAWCAREKSMNSTQSLLEYDTTSQSGAMSDGDYEMSVSEKLSTFDSAINKIQSNFPDEDTRFWSSIFAPIRRVIQEKYPSRPAVVLIATSKPYSATAEALSREVALLIETLYNMNDNSDTYLTLEATELNSLNPSAAKLQMDYALSDNYKRRHMVSVIHDLGSLPATSVTLLPAYCHRESAHFKKAVLLATVYMESGMTFNADDVEAHLLEVWQELEEDISIPIISILANNIAMMENTGIGG